MLTDLLCRQQSCSRRHQMSTRVTAGSANKVSGSVAAVNGCLPYTSELMHLLTAVVICRERRFVLSYFLADDTLSIFEPPQRNTGITGGKYLERSKVS